MKQCVGYVCATVIVVAMLVKDGDVANATAAATGMALAGLGTWAVAKTPKE